MVDAHSVRIHMDNRDRPIIGIFAQQLGLPKDEFDKMFRLENLEVGDFLFFADDEPIMLYERKTIADFFNSLRTSRFSEQMLNMMQTHTKNPKLGICMILEGNLEEEIKNSGWDLLYIRDLLRNLYPTYRVAIAETINDMDTVCFLLKTMQHFQLFGSKYAFDESFILCKSFTGKKRNIAPKEKFINSLQRIDGISQSIARKIEQRYKSYENLAKAYAQCSTVLQKKQMFVGFDHGAKRKIGEKVSERIYEWFSCIEVVPGQKTVKKKT